MNERDKDTSIRKIFDYDALEESQRVRLQAKAEAIKLRMKRTAEDIIAVGQDFIEVKAELEHGQFKAWLRAEFDLSYDTALNFMQAARRFQEKIKNGNFPFLPTSVFYKLAAPKMPDEIVEGVLRGDIPANVQSIEAAKQAYIARKKAEEASAIIETAKKEAGIAPVLPYGTTMEEEQWRQSAMKYSRALVYNADKLQQLLKEVHHDRLRRARGITGSLETVRKDLQEALHLIDEILQHDSPS